MHLFTEVKSSPRWSRDILLGGLFSKPTHPPSHQSLHKFFHQVIFNALLMFVKSSTSHGADAFGLMVIDYEEPSEKGAGFGEMDDGGWFEGCYEAAQLFCS